MENFYSCLPLYIYIIYDKIYSVCMRIYMYKCLLRFLRMYCRLSVFGYMLVWVRLETFLKLTHVLIIKSQRALAKNKFIHCFFPSYFISLFLSLSLSVFLSHSLSLSLSSFSFFPSFLSFLSSTYFPTSLSFFSLSNPSHNLFFI